MPNPDEQPQAEIWMRAHPAGCSGIEVGANTVSLQDAIAKSPDTVFGERTLKKFAGLPFLMKILSAESALSLKVHPDKRQAVEGYAR